MFPQIVRRLPISCYCTVQIVTGITLHGTFFRSVICQRTQKDVIVRQFSMFICRNIILTLVEHGRFTIRYIMFLQGDFSFRIRKNIREVRSRFRQASEKHFAHRFARLASFPTSKVKYSLPFSKLHLSHRIRCSQPLFAEYLMHKRHCDRSFADCGCYALNVSRAHVTHGENTRQAGFE